MKRRPSRSIRAGLLAVLGVLSVFFIATASDINGQPFPNGPRTNPNPGFPNPNVRQPNTNPGFQNPNVGMPQPGVPQQVVTYETIWSCESCGREVSRGSSPPSMSKCPHCGISIDYYRGPDGQKRDNPSSESSAGRMGALVKIGLFVLVGIIVGVVKLARGGSKKEEPERRRVVEDRWESDRRRERSTRRDDKEDSESDRRRERPTRREDKDDDEPFDFSKIR